VNNLYSISIDRFLHVVKTDKRALDFSPESMGAAIQPGHIQDSTENMPIFKHTLKSPWFQSASLTVSSALDIVSSTAGICRVLFKAPTEISSHRKDTFDSSATDIMRLLGKPGGNLSPGTQWELRPSQPRDSSGLLTSDYQIFYF